MQRTRIAVGSFFVALVILIFAWVNRSWIENQVQVFLQNRVIDQIVREIQPHVPFKIESVKATGNWQDFKTGRLSSLAIQLKTPGWDGKKNSLSVQLQGPLDLVRSKSATQIAFHYPAQVLISGPGLPDPLTLTLDLKATLRPTPFEILDLDTEIQTAAVKIPTIGLESENLLLRLAFHEQKANLQISLGSWVLTRTEQTIHFDKLDFRAETPLKLSPVTMGPKIHIAFSAKDLELLMGEKYINLPVQGFPLEVDLEVEPDPGKTPFLKSLSLSLPTQKQKNPQRFRFQYGFDSKNLSWNLPASDLSTLINLIEVLPKGMKLHRGRINTNGRGKLGSAYEGSVKADGIELGWENEALWASGLQLDLPFEVKKNALPQFKRASVAIQKIEFKHLQATLPKTQFSIQNDPANPKIAHLETNGPLGLKVQGIPMRWGKVSATYSEIPKNPSDESLVFKTSLILDGIPVNSILDGLCISVPLPSTLVTGNFSQIEITPDWIDPTGDLMVQVLGGNLKVSDIGFYDLGSGVPELDFTADWDKVRLELLGEWLGFGEMDGVLSGYAHDVTFQGWLPTLFDFRAEVKPLNHWKVVFSPDAMKNFVRLFAGPEIDALPGFANWLAFGWPSRVFGGYDVHYAGVSLYSKEGSILLETLDPEKILNIERKHFILYGPRFKMPLQSSRYPVVLDAAGIANYGKHMLEQLDVISKNKTQQEQSHETDSSRCLPPSLDTTRTQSQ